MEVTLNAYHNFADSSCKESYQSALSGYDDGIQKILEKSPDYQAGYKQAMKQANITIVILMLIIAVMAMGMNHLGEIIKTKEIADLIGAGCSNESLTEKLADKMLDKVDFDESEQNEL